MYNKEFKNFLLKEVQDHFPLCKVEEVVVRKNNNTGLEGFTVRVENSNVAPTFYFDELYDSRRSIQSIFDFIESALSAAGDISPTFDKNLVEVAVINYELNKERLKDLVHKPFLDLAIILRLKCLSMDGENGYVTISRSMVSRYGWDVEELFDIGYRNTECQLELILFTDLFGEDVSTGGIFSISNKSLSYGGASILFPKFIETHVGEGYIIPSSVHDIILMQSDIPADSARAMIASVNDSIVDKQDILSYNLYELRDGVVSIVE